MWPPWEGVSGGWGGEAFLTPELGWAGHGCVINALLKLVRLLPWSALYLRSVWVTGQHWPLFGARKILFGVSWTECLLSGWWLSDDFCTPACFTRHLTAAEQSLVVSVVLLLCPLRSWRYFRNCPLCNPFTVPQKWIFFSYVFHNAHRAGPVTEVGVGSVQAEESF